jgi:Domain of unknown function (DUF4832)/Domain of unknown function (DUF4874)
MFFLNGILHFNLIIRLYWNVIATLFKINIFLGYALYTFVFFQVLKLRSGNMIKVLINFVFFTITSMVIVSDTSAKTYAETVSTTYEGSNENFANPERGFFIPFDPARPMQKDEVYPLNLSDLQNVRSQGITLVRRYYLLKDFKDKAISEAFLNMIESDLKLAREAGVKLIIGFSYNWLGGGEDASKAQIFSHLDQLKPILEKNYDVISYMEAGFIGHWGEWNRSTNKLDSNSEDRRDILFKILATLPDERMVALRYPYYKRDAFNNLNPLTPEEAFKGTYQARTGAVNNCFLASADDWGTYDHTDPKIVNEQKDFLHLDNRFVVQGGEVCDTSEYDDCPNALQDLARMRWSALNFEPSDAASILEDWEKQGCMAEIKNRLGYRFRLTKSTIPNQVQPGGEFSMSFEIANDGWASPYNPRKLEVILRNTKTREEYFLSVKEDPRMWMPGTQNSVNITAGIPENMPQGEYDLFLNLPDSAPSLYNLPNFSIRLANQNLWEAATGYNSLQRTVSINLSTTMPNYSGGEFFRPR